MRLLRIFIDFASQHAFPCSTFPTNQNGKTARVVHSHLKLLNNLGKTTLVADNIFKTIFCLFFHQYILRGIVCFFLKQAIIIQFYQAFTNFFSGAFQNAGQFISTDPFDSFLFKTLYRIHQIVFIDNNPSLHYPILHILYPIRAGIAPRQSLPLQEFHQLHSVCFYTIPSTAHNMENARIPSITQFTCTRLFKA